MAQKKTPGRSTGDNSGSALISPPGDGELMARVIGILDQARANVVHAVNSNMVIAYWLIGREIVMALQNGEQRADYGTQLIEELSAFLTLRCGRGFSVSNLKYFRQFFQTYAERRPEIRHEPRGESGIVSAQQSADANLQDELAIALAGHDSLQGFSPRLSWIH
jgi:hypothetical protein